MSETNGPKSNISKLELESLSVLQPPTELVGSSYADQEKSIDNDRQFLTPVIDMNGEVMCLAWKNNSLYTSQLFYLENEACFNC